MDIEEVVQDACRRLRREVSEGLVSADARLSKTRIDSLEAAAFLYALVELLVEKNLLSIDELDDRKRDVAKRLVRKHEDDGGGVLLQEPEYDKYNFQEEVEIDCATRIHLCGAACCRLPFALSRQDIREGVVRWDLGQPYLIAQGEDGYCTHLQPGNCRCTVHEKRPVPCRAYDCRKEKKIWLDFEKGVVNPDIYRPDWPREPGIDKESEV